MSGPQTANSNLLSSRLIAAALGAAAVLLSQVLSCNHPPPTGPANVSLTVSGKITANNVASKGVTVQLSGDKTASAVTDSLGDYSFTDLGNGLYSIKPSQSGFSFNPGDIQVELAGASRGSLDFKMVQQAPQLVVQKDKIDFGSLQIGASRQVKLGLSNIGLRSLTISTFTFSSAVFSGGTPNLTILSDSLVYVTLTFKPAATGLVSGELTIASNDPSTPAQKITLTGTGIAGVKPAIQASQASLDLGSVQIGSGSTAKLTLTNTGSDILHLSSVTTTNKIFSVDVPSLAIASGRSLDLTVTFTPADTGKKSAQLTVVSDATNSPSLNVALSGTGFKSLPSSIKVEPADLDFGNVYLDSLASRDLKITNTGSDSLLITLLRITGTGFSTSQSGSAIIGPQKSATFTIFFRGTNLGISTGRLTIFNSDPQQVSLDVPLKARLINIPPATVRVHPDSLAFGTVNVGSVGQNAFWVVNPNPVPLNILNITFSDSNFSTQQTALQVPAGDSVQLTVNYTPEAAGALLAQMTISTDAVDNPSIQIGLSGTGFQPVTGKIALGAGQIDFGTASIGQTLIASLTVGNTGDGRLFLSGASIDLPVFTVSQPPDSLEPGGSTTLELQFTPAVLGSARGALVITNSDPDQRLAKVILLGAGIDTSALLPLMQLSQRTLDLGPVIQNLTGTTLLTVSNIGKDTLRVTDIRTSLIEFSANPKQFAVAPSQTLDVTVSFTPFGTGPLTGGLVIFSNDQLRKQDTLTVKGTGVTESGQSGSAEVFINGGTFLMGFSGEIEPVRAVTVSSFYMEANEATNEQFKQFMDAGGYNRIELWTTEGWTWRTTVRDQGFDPDNPRPRFWGTGAAPWESDPYSNRPNSPVVGVSWYEASAYAKYRNKSLPTETQWEYAARGVEGRIYPWGNVWQPGNLNHGQERSPYYDESDGFRYAAPVGSYPSGATPTGLSNMAGNVMEWCLDWYADYNPNETFNPKGPASGLYRVIRGGSWNGSILYCRAFHRNNSESKLRYKDCGIRLVRSF